MEIINLKQAALDYAAKGFPVIPIMPKKTYSVSSTYPTTDAGQIERWWKAKFNVGIPTGSQSGVMIVNFKTNESLDAAQVKGLPLTPIAVRGKEFDIYFKYQEGLDKLIDKERFPDVTFYSEDKFILAPPSVVELQPPSSLYKPEVYSWCEGKSLADLPLADMPSWLLKGQEAAEPTPQSEVQVVQHDQSIAEPVVVSKEQNEDQIEVSPVYHTTSFKYRFC